MRLTGRGLGASIAAALLLAVGAVGRYPLLAVLGAVLTGAVAAAVALSGGSLRVQVHRSVHPSRVTRGRPALARLTVTNPAGRRVAAFEASDQAGPGRCSVRVPTLAAGGATVLRYELPTGERGKWTVGPLVLDRRDAFGFARESRPAGDTTTLWVHPRRFPARSVWAGDRWHRHVGQRGAAGLRGTSDLTDVREYVPGDEVRLLHWKATARTGRLMVRDLTDPPGGRFTVLLDTRAAGTSPESFEELIEVAASLLCASAETGRATCLLTSGGTRTATDGAPRSASRLLDALAEAGRTDHEPVPPRRDSGALAVVSGDGTTVVPASLLKARFDPVFVLTLAEATAAPPGITVVRAPTPEGVVRRWNEAVG